VRHPGLWQGPARGLCTGHGCDAKGQKIDLPVVSHPTYSMLLPSTQHFIFKHTFTPNTPYLPKILRQIFEVILNRCSSVKCSRRNL
jgi:hypothetical protein